MDEHYSISLIDIKINSYMYILYQFKGNLYTYTSEYSKIIVTLESLNLNIREIKDRNKSVCVQS